jgi:hypothetical protein
MVTPDFDDNAVTETRCVVPLAEKVSTSRFSGADNPFAER